MKLIDKVGLPPIVYQALYKLLVKAGQAVRAKTWGVVVIVCPSRYRLAGVAGAGTHVTVKVGRGRTRRYRSDRAAFWLWLPRVPALRKLRPMAGELACRIFDIARHEFAHVADIQSGNPQSREWSRREKGRRRPPWRERPEELRVQIACDEADARGRDLAWARDELSALTEALLSI